MNIWAFNWTKDENRQQQIYESLLTGRSRFGWSGTDEANLLLESNRAERNNSRQLFLLKIEPGDWIVHINTPQWGECVAARVLLPYDFDGGLQLEGETDFRHFLAIDPSSIVGPFDRPPPNVRRSINLRPRKRYQRVYAVEDFLALIENV